MSAKRFRHPARGKRRPCPLPPPRRSPCDCAGSGAAPATPPHPPPPIGRRRSHVTAGPHVSEVCSLPEVRGGRPGGWPPARGEAGGGRQTRGLGGNPTCRGGAGPVGRGGGGRGLALHHPPAARRDGTRMSTGPRGGSWWRRFRREAQARARPRGCYVSRSARARAAPVTRPRPGLCHRSHRAQPHPAGSRRGAYISVCVGSICWGSGAPGVPSDPDDSVTRAEGSLLPGAVGTCWSKGTPGQERAVRPCGAAAPKQALKQQNEFKWSLLHR